MSVPVPPETTEAATPAAASAPSESPIDRPGGEPPLGTPGDDAAVAAAAPAAGPTGAVPEGPTPGPADVLHALRQSFPALFAGAVKPLKLRIQVDIQQRAPGRFGKQALSAFFRRHTGSTSYLLAITRAPHRFDLDGQPAGEISAEHRQVALDELARRRDSQQSRRDLEDQQRRNRAGLLHDFDTTTLTRANFCALKGVPVEELDGLLALARDEAKERAQQMPSRPSTHDRGPRGAGGGLPSQGGGRNGGNGIRTAEDRGRAVRASGEEASRPARGPGGPDRRPARPQQPARGRR